MMILLLASVICDSSKQVKNVCSLNAQYAKTPTKTNEEFSIAYSAEPEVVYLSTKNSKSRHQKSRSEPT